MRKNVDKSVLKTIFQQESAQSRTKTSRSRGYTYKQFTVKRRSVHKHNPNTCKKGSLITNNSAHEPARTIKKKKLESGKKEVFLINYWNFLNFSLHFVSMSIAFKHMYRVRFH